ncbi:MAG: bacteriorhodopsin-like [Microbacteriaceae bacterium]
MIPDILSQGQYDTVYNFLSLVIASQLFTAVFLLISLPRILPRYRQAITVAIVVCGIAAYHYFRIFDSFKAAYVTTATGGAGDYMQTTESFNEGYRYVDWLLTVPLLLVELIAVLALARSVQSALLKRLVPAAALMIALGYLGEILPGDDPMRGIWGLLSSIPFAYILFVLFVQLGKSLDRQPVGVRRKLSNLRFLLLLSWGVYPIAYLLPMLNITGSDAWVGKQIGYSVADILAKAVYAIIIYQVARIKSFDDDPKFAELEGEHEDVIVAPVATKSK